MAPTPLTPAQVLAFYKASEKLKTTLRHSWLNDGIRRESVAEHTWMMSLLALVLGPQMSQPLDLAKVLQMIIVHDLAEAVTTDMPVWEGTRNSKAKAKAEESAIQQLFGTLDKKTGQDLFAVWLEYEERKSPESLFVKALDTLDVVAQHNLAPIETWDDNDFLWQLSPLQNAFFDFDVLLRNVKDQIDEWSIQKVGAAQKLEKLDQTELKKRTKS